MLHYCSFITLKNEKRILTAIEEDSNGIVDVITKRHRTCQNEAIHTEKSIERFRHFMKTMHGIDVRGLLEDGCEPTDTE